MPQEPLDDFVIAVLYDFVGFMCVRPGGVRFGLDAPSPPIAEMLRDFLALRGVDQSRPPRTGWAARCAGVSSAPQGRWVARAQGHVGPFGQALYFAGAVIAGLPVVTDGAEMALHFVDEAAVAAGTRESDVEFVAVLDPHIAAADETARALAAAAQR